MPGWLIAVCVAAGLVAWYFLLIWALSRLTGWATLAREYATDREPPGEKFTWEGARLRSWGFYNSCLVIVVSAEGLYLRVFKPFAIGHRPLLIPWPRIRHLRDGTILGQDATFLEIATHDKPIALLVGPEVWRAGQPYRG